MKLLLATDGTAQSTAAVEMIKNIRIREGDELKIVTVIDMAIPMAFDAYAGYLPNTDEIERVARENADKILEETRTSIEDCIGDERISISSEILIGSPESRIVEVSEDYGADVIVVGSHGYSRWERMLLGSVSNSVVHHAPCSVLVVRGPNNS